MLKVINKEKHNELAMSAKLHGLTIKPYIEADTKTDAEAAEIDRHSKDMLRRMKLRYAERSLKNG